MGKKEAINIAEKYVQKVKGQFIVRDAMLFGSCVKGTNNDESDIDIALIFDELSDVIDTQIELMKMRRDIDLRIEPHPFRVVDFNIDDPIVSEIINSGVKIITLL